MSTGILGEECVEHTYGVGINHSESNMTSTQARVLYCALNKNCTVEIAAEIDITTTPVSVKTRAKRAK